IQNWPLPPSPDSNLVTNASGQTDNSRAGKSNLAGGIPNVADSDPVSDSTRVVPIDPEIVAHLHASIGKCTACGFPVSGGRSLCLDCEASNVSEASTPASASTASFLDHYSDPKPGNWFSRNIYWIGIVVMALATLALLAFKSR
ncbi:MAG: hypothetical protein ACRD4I_03725, partial [Candidatus Angelobacter sp.]